MNQKNNNNNNNSNDVSTAATTKTKSQSSNQKKSNNHKSNSMTVFRSVLIDLMLVLLLFLDQTILGWLWSSWSSSSSSSSSSLSEYESLFQAAGLWTPTTPNDQNNNNNNNNNAQPPPDVSHLIHTTKTRTTTKTMSTNNDHHHPTDRQEWQPPLLLSFFSRPQPPDNNNGNEEKENTKRSTGTTWSRPFSDAERHAEVQAGIQHVYYFHKQSLAKTTITTDLMRNTSSYQRIHPDSLLSMSSSSSSSSTTLRNPLYTNATVPLDELPSTSQLYIRLLETMAVPSSSSLQQQLQGRRNHKMTTATKNDNNHDSNGLFLILSDTYQLGSDWTRIQQQLQYVPDDWDIIRFQCYGMKRYPNLFQRVEVEDMSNHTNPEEDGVSLFRTGNSPLAQRLQRCGGYHAMVWRRSSLPKLHYIWTHPHSLDSTSTSTSTSTTAPLDCQIATWTSPPPSKTATNSSTTRPTVSSYCFVNNKYLGKDRSGK